MRIETITFAYNEEFLLPYYLKHYNFLDKLNIFYDSESTDSTLEILKSNSKTNIIYFKFPNLYDDKIRINLLNEYYKKSNCDAILNVDVDEFVFCNRINLEKHLRKNDTIYVKFANVYRNKKEDDLNIKKSIMSQRKYGFFSSEYYKPIITRTKLDILWKQGSHKLLKGKAVDCGFLGAHWANADPKFCIERRIKNRKLRQSENNIKNEHSLQHHYCTEDSITKECKDHENDPFIFDEYIKFL